MNRVVIPNNYEVLRNYLIITDCYIFACLISEKLKLKLRSCHNSYMNRIRLTERTDVVSSK